MIIFNWYIHIMLQGPAMLPTTITSEVTQLKEKVRVLEVRFLVCVGKFCGVPNIVNVSCKGSVRMQWW